MTAARPLRVLFAIGSLERGGGERQLVALLEQLHPGRAHCALVTLGAAADPELQQRLRAAGVRHTVLAPRAGRLARLPRALGRLAGLIHRTRPDVLYAWLEEAVVVTAPVARALGVPVAVARRNVSGPYARWPRPFSPAIARAERLAAVVTANSEAVARESLARGVPAERIRIVRNGHAVGAPLPAPALPDGPVALGYVARFREEKGHLRLLDALEHVRTTVPWRVDLAGDGALHDRVAAEVRRRRLDERVRFVGPIDDPRAFWADRHVGVLLSDHEGSPNALIEAALAGRPLVGTAVGGIPDVVGDGGCVVAPEDPAAIGAALARLVGDRELRERLGAAAYRHAAAEFGLERFVAGHLAAIEAAAGRA
jgi:glycosyltransferase involved in cell wall biosynthesis